ncbi:MAG TPA: hypothetical protein VKA19_04430 [Alphaproteobacteria bacterium]|nr:hypothetical protein [Alphaproteobacteria bacterium]
MSHTHKPTDGTILGRPLTDVTTGTTTDGENAAFALGTKVQATNGQTWMYVQAAEAITQYDFVAIDENYQMSQITATEAGDGWHIGVAQNAFADNDLGWVCIAGSNANGRLAGSTAADAALYTSPTAGALDDVSTVGTKIDGVVAVTGNTTTAVANVEVLLTFPRSSAF